MATTPLRKPPVIPATATGKRTRKNQIRPPSPKDSVPITINGKQVDRNDIPSIRLPEEKSVVPDSDDEEIISAVSQTTQTPTPEYEEDSSVESSRQPTPVRQMVLERPNLPEVQVEPTPEPKVQPELEPTKTLQKPSIVPESLIKATRYKLFRAIDVPEYEFFNSQTSSAMITVLDKYLINENYRARCMKIHTNYPQLVMPVIRDEDDPAASRYKFEIFRKRGSAEMTAGYISKILLIIVAGIELFLTRVCKLNAVGYFRSQFKSVDEYKEIIKEMGENSFTFMNGTLSPIWKLCMVFFSNMVIFILFNYIGSWLPDAFRSNSENWLKKGFSKIMGFKDNDPEEKDDDGNGILNNILSMFNSLNEKPKVDPTQPIYPE
jgi:hypothetical protein